MKFSHIFSVPFWQEIILTSRIRSLLNRHMVKKCLPEVDEQIVRNEMQDDKVLFINATNIIGDTLTGLVAIKVAEKYNRPCVMLRRRSDDGEYGGSCRNIDYSPLENLKEFLESLGTFEFVSGHPNAAGVGIKRGNVQVSIDKCNKLIKETIAWKDYFTDMDGMLDIYLDRFVYVRDCYEYLSGLLRDNKLVPKNLLTEYKIQSNTVADIIMELSNKTTNVNDKIQKIKIFSSYLNAYISYLNNVYFKLYAISKGYGSRYWRTIE